MAQAEATVKAYDAPVDESANATASKAGKPVSWQVFQNKAIKFLKDCKDRMRGSAITRPIAVVIKC